MTTYLHAPRYGIKCDNCGCEHEDIYELSSRDARDEATHQDWISTGAKDYCDSCSQCRDCGHWPDCHEDEICRCWLNDETCGKWRAPDRQEQSE